MQFSRDGRQKYTIFFIFPDKKNLRERQRAAHTGPLGFRLFPDPVRARGYGSFRAFQDRLHQASDRVRPAAVRTVGTLHGLHGVAVEAAAAGSQVVGAQLLCDVKNALGYGIK